MISMEKYLKIAIKLGLSIVIPLFLSWVILFLNHDVSSWIGYAFGVFFLAFWVVLYSIKDAYTFAIKKPTTVKLLLFGSVYYLLWSGFIFFWFLLAIRWML